MKFRAAHLFFFLALVAYAVLISGCAATESDNASVRPWNTPQGWEGSSLGGMDNMQHP
jgi:hypothetical protein